MTTPTPLPPDALAGLHDVVVPAPVSLVPATPAWLVALALLLAGLAWGAIRVLRRRRRNLYRREALAELRAVEARLGSPATHDSALAQLPVLVKRVALHVVPRDRVASLSAGPLLALLDLTWKGNAFTTGPGRLLPEIAYGSPERVDAIPAADVDALVALLRRWIGGHRAIRPGARGPGA